MYATIQDSLCLAVAISQLMASSPSKSPAKDGAKQGEPGLVSLLLKSDAAEELPFVPISITQGLSQFSGYSDYQGVFYTAGSIPNFAEFQIAEVVTTIGATVDAQTVGQKFSIPLIASKGTSYPTASLIRYTPVARPVHFGGSYDWDGVSPFWSAAPVWGTNLDFHANVALLRSKPILNAYFSFKGQKNPGFEMGLLLKAASNVDLGANGLVFRIDTRGNTVGAFPNLGSFHIGEGPNGSTLNLEPHGFDAANPTVLKIRVSGQLLKGDNLILIGAEDAGLPAFRSLKDLSGFPSSRQGLQTKTVAGPSCTPPAPACSTNSSTCEPEEPVDVLSKPDLMEQTLHHQLFFLPPTVCPATGDGNQPISWNISVSGGVNIGLTIGSSNAPASLNIGANGSVEGTLTFGGTAQEGECSSFWLCFHRITNRWEVCVASISIDGVEYCVDIVEEETKCERIELLKTTCQ